MDSLFFLFYPLGVCWFVVCLSERQRTPFDLAEGESELVSGFNTEYRASYFALLFLGEYMSILFMCILRVFLVFGCSLDFFFFFFFFFWFLRYLYDLVARFLVFVMIL